VASQIAMRWATLAVVIAAASLTGRAQEPVFRAGVDLVTVDAIVVDGDGHPVVGLTADDFLLTVDGQPRTIDAFEMVAVRATEAPRDARLPDVTSNDVAEPGRVILLVVDRSNLRLGDGRAALEGLKGLIDNLSPRDRLGLFTMPGGGPVIAPTGDHQAVVETIRRIRGMESVQPDPSLLMTFDEAIRIDRRVPGSMTRVVERNCVGGGTPRPEEVFPDAVSGRLTGVNQCEARITSEAGRLVRETRARNLDALTAFDTLLDGLRDVDARKTFVYVSNGLVFDREIQGRLRQIGAKVAAASATFYAIQVYAPPMDATASGLAPDWEEDRRVRAEGLDYLSGMSGGALFRPAAGLRVVSARIARETSARYAIGFQVNAAERDGKAHRIKVALRRPRGVTVRHRTEFVAEPRGRRARAPETLAAALSAPAILPAVPLRVATTLVPDGSAQPKVLVAAAVGSTSLAGRYARSRLAYEVLDGDGRRYGQTEEVDAITPLYTVALKLRPGRYRIKVAARDGEGRIGTVEHPFEVTAPPADALHVGGVMLFRDAGDGRQPDLLVDVPAGEREIGTHVFVHAPSAASIDGVGANLDVTHLDEQVSRFNGPMALTCSDARTACEFDAGVPAARWPAGRYRAEVTLLRQGAELTRVARTFDLVPVIAAGAPAETTASAAPAAAPRSAALDALLSKATAYVDAFAERAVSTVADERYVQAIVDSPAIDRAVALAWREDQGQARRRTSGVAARRQIRADLLMLKTGDGWFANFRDVAAVDGKPVKDRDARAMQLFTGTGGQAGASYARIHEEGARYNLGNVRRTVNVPTMALFVLHPRHIGRFEFEPAGSETIDGVPTTVVRFREKRAPAFIQTGRGDDVFSSGRVWLAEDGSVRQTALHVDERESGIRVRLEVTYREVPSLGRLMPVEMRETYTNVPGDRLRSIEGRATYDNFRVFRVTTSEGTAHP
jgi:VWFA-related protein